MKQQVNNRFKKQKQKMCQINQQINKNINKQKQNKIKKNKSNKKLINKQIKRINYLFKNITIQIKTVFTIIKVSNLRVQCTFLNQNQDLMHQIYQYNLTFINIEQQIQSQFIIQLIEKIEEKYEKSNKLINNKSKS
ncbi:hypothetical protein TTHERM_000656220 (macronuclear) [Tetrahymena thermophila SB210]|uniref:Uncharacterized protein n=1 Tax=Tetrahymena thermophila (strain SB210) TaxID=312017 RepID=W7X7G6_TETTS|nr:hypothetical protein TTHERM_000656220 [Tetrahymena thermophila SB210]EWS72323.1 hypothetical protein TTHERM_000656220 [Tetrahymena thermophila SB210]|eukprot:XP_012655157.1 hypothetical protein TTHERM_000656220 [Tetrahymena thermophila SB210]